MPNSQRIFYLKLAMEKSYSVDQLYKLTGIDPWFLDHLLQLIECEARLRAAGGLDQVDLLRRAERWGFSDRQIAHILGLEEDVVRSQRHALGVLPV